MSLLEKQRAIPAAALADLACALCGLAASYRIGGRRDHATDALLLAFPLAELADDPMAEGIWLQKAAYLLVDLDRCDRAYEAVEAAGLAFIAAQAVGEQVQVLVDKGFVLSHAKQSEAALKELRRALRLLPADDIENRVAAHQLMFVELERLGRYPEAGIQLAKAFEIVGDFKLFQASLHWCRGRLAVLMAEPASAVADFEAALTLYRRFGSAADVAELTFEYAELLLQLKRHGELRRLAAATSKWVSAARGHRKIREVLENFAALAPLKKLDADSIAEVRKELPPRKKPAPSYRKKPQPFGGICIPVSGSSSVDDTPLGGISMPISTSAPELGAPFGGTSMPISAKRKTN